MLSKHAVLMSCLPAHKNCAGLYKAGKRTSGVYKIDPDGAGAFDAYCDQTTAGGGEKSPWGQCLTRPVPTVAAVLASDWCQKNTSKTLSPGALLAVLYFSSCHIFPPV